MSSLQQQQQHSVKVLNDQTNNWLLQQQNQIINWNGGYYNGQEQEEQENNNNNNRHLNYQTSLFTTQKLNNSTTKLSYTPYQLELLNSIYNDMKYPNSVQKTLIAKLIGITRDQVKVFLFLFLFLYLFISTINRFGFKIEDVKIQSIHNMELEEIIKKVV
jgi:hypothetical protein